MNKTLITKIFGALLILIAAHHIIRLPKESVVMAIAPIESLDEETAVADIINFGEILGFKGDTKVKSLSRIHMQHNQSQWFRKYRYELKVLDSTFLQLKKTEFTSLGLPVLTTVENTATIEESQELCKVVVRYLPDLEPESLEFPPEEESKTAR